MLFWPEISALGVFFNFDNKRMHPPKYLSDPPGSVTSITYFGCAAVKRSTLNEHVLSGSGLEAGSTLKLSF